MSKEGYQESASDLPSEVKDMHRAIVSLKEELDALDSYNQRLALCKDPELKGILDRLRAQEKEHAAMLLEWIRRKDEDFSKELKNFLFTDKPIPQDQD